MNTPRFRFWTDKDLEELPPPTWLINRLIVTESFAVLYGASGIGKSFVALALAVAVALQREALGLATIGGRVVYVAAEAAGGIPCRVAALKDWLGVTEIPGLLVVPDPVYLHDGVNLGAYLAELRAREPGPIALTVIDTLSRCSAGSDENSNADRELTVEGVHHIREATQGAVLAVHHTGWNEERMRGGYSLKAATDTILALKKADGGLELRIEKQRDVEGEGDIIPLILRRHLQSLIAAAGERRASHLTEQQSRALRELQKIAISDGIGTTAWLKSAKMPESSFYAARKVLIDNGYVASIRKGRYTVSPTGLELLQLHTNSNGLQNGVGTNSTPQPPFKGAGVGVPEVEELERGDAWEPDLPMPERRRA